MNDNERSDKPLPSDFQRWANEMRLDEAEDEVVNTVIDLHEFGMYSEFISGNLLNPWDPDAEIEMELSAQDRADLDAMEMTQQQLYTNLREELQGKGFVIRVNGVHALDFIEAWDHIDDHDCEWGYDIAQKMLESLYIALGAMMFGGHDD